MQSKTGWSVADIDARVGTRITTHGAEGVEIAAPDGSVLRVGALPARETSDPTGVGDAFRGGFLAGRAVGLPLPRCAELGALMATLVLETIGTQEYTFDPAAARQRVAEHYGQDSAG